MSNDLRPSHYGNYHHSEKGRLKAVSAPVPSGAVMIRILEHDGAAYRQIWAGVTPEVDYADRLVTSINSASAPFSPAPSAEVAP